MLVDVRFVLWSQGSNNYYESDQSYIRSRIDVSSYDDLFVYLDDLSLSLSKFFPDSSLSFHFSHSSFDSLSFVINVSNAKVSQ